MVLFFEAAGLELLWLLLVAVVVAKDGEDDLFLEFEFDFSMLVSSLFFVEVGEKNDIKDIFLTHGSLVYPVGLGNQCYFSSIVAWVYVWGRSFWRGVVQAGFASTRVKMVPLLLPK